MLSDCAFPMIRFAVLGSCADRIQTSSMPAPTANQSRHDSSGGKCARLPLPLFTTCYDVAFIGI
jgi:hypothetical protein